MDDLARKTRLEVLGLGLDLDIRDLSALGGVLDGCELLMRPLDLSSRIEGSAQKLVLCGAFPPEIPVAEGARAVAAAFGNATLIAVLRGRAQLDRDAYMAAGFADAFLYPFEAGALRRALEVALARLTHGAVRAYRCVHVSDLLRGSRVPAVLALHLPRNNKFVHFLNAGDEFSKTHAERLENRHVGILYVEASSLPAFYEYALRNARVLNPAVRLSTSERRHKLEDGLRSAVMAMLRPCANADARIAIGKRVMADLDLLVRTCVLDAPTTDLGTRMLAMFGAPVDSYAHLVNTAVYSALFSMGLDLGNPVDAALAGLLHDLGEMDRGRENGLPDDHSHAKATIALLDGASVPMRPNVATAILEHHDTENGNRPSSGVSKETLALGLADALDYATRLDPDLGMSSYDDALARFRSRVNLDSAIVDRALGLLSR